MSSGFQPSEFQSSGPLIDDSYNVSRNDHPSRDKIQTQQASETRSTSLRLRFHNLSLDELSEKLDRRTKETQRLQEEVENATRIALESFGCTYGNSSPGTSNCLNDSSEDGILSTHQQTVSHSLVCNLYTLNEEVVQSNQNSSQKDVLKNVVDNCLQQLSELQLKKMHDWPEQDTFNHQRATMNLQIKLHEAQMEKNGLRLKDSREHIDQMEKMLCMLEELQNIKRSADQKLQDTEDEALALKRKVETLEKAVKEMYHLLYEKQCGHNFITPKGANSQTQQSLANEYGDLINKRDKIQERCFSPKEQQRNEVYSGVKKEERIEDLITSLGQEMAMLTDKLSSSKDSGVGLCVKLELLKKLSERQASLHQRQISELESTLASYKDKVCCLEQQLTEAQTQLFDTQRDRDHSLQQAKELQAYLQQLKNCCKQQQLELQEDAEILRGQLEVTREQLSKAGEENICLQALMDQRALEDRKFLGLLQEKDAELCLRQQKIQQHLVRLEEARSQCQTLQAEQETLRLKLNEREKMMDDLTLQMESSVQMTVQHRHMIDSLQQENNLLINQLNQHKLDIHQLRADLVQHKSDLAVAECGRRQLQASVTEQSQRVREANQQKQEITSQLELQHMQLLTLTKEHKELQLLHSCKNDEHEGVVMKLQSRLRSAHDELDKIGPTLRALEGADGHGLQVALDMQKEITARREQVDSLQGKIQHLEENMEKLQQEKRYQNLETQRQLQELIFIREEKRQLVNELKALRSKDQQLRERISELEAILHKMSESFANCQDFIQLKEQEYFRLKLQHALDLKELQGQNLCTGLNVLPPDLDSLTRSAHTVPPSSQCPSNIQIESKRQQESSPGKLGFLIRELRGEISGNHRPHTDKSSSFYRRRSAPEGEHRTTFSDSNEELKAGSRLGRKTCSREPQFLMTTELNGKMISKNPVTAEVYTSFPKLLSLGRRSPVNSLLTSNPNS
ncbi:coiled-coil domain-containing protein 158-like isoform X2 [Melanotaenia boesemani]|uniref:coiled-coil domain-containing protein 158-like isoform X2 n=1 Tax=Melanotaenia boesemani TaxID=1250792 RepID=UPI001C049534|nr:coiled-coil domain-containing protein 158-like isoform X2 [Melanotaenia boesemani]